MNALDWLVLGATLAFIVGYGLWRTRGIRTTEAYLRGGSLRFWTIGLSIMATQASAITFLSMPGQAHEDGLGFVQFYFGLPVAMVLLSATIVPLYHQLEVYTAYEYLERRFDLRTRQLTALLFLLSRGLAAGLSIYAPAIVLSTLLGWPLHLTNLVIGLAVIAYTVSGGTRAVAQTQTWQMTVMLGGMLLAFAFVLHALPAGVTFGRTLEIAGALGKLQVVSYSPRLDTRYTFWSGLTGGLFVQLAYFGTDQSQVQRYLSGSSLTESRLGLLMNGLIKIPMQLVILFVGILVLVFHQFAPPPVFFNQPALEAARRSPEAAQVAALEAAWARATSERRARVEQLLGALEHAPAEVEDARAAVARADAQAQAIRARAKRTIARAVPGAEANDNDYLFLGFVTRHFPHGLIGLLLAVILCAAMSSTASALNALGTTTVVDFYRRWQRPGHRSDAHYLAAAKWLTVGWGLVAMAFAASASLFDNLIQAVNILGSIFYGPMLGVFVVGFFFRGVRGPAAFWATLFAQAAVVAVWRLSSIGFLWYNVVGCAVVVLLALAFEGGIRWRKRAFRTRRESW